MYGEYEFLYSEGSACARYNGVNYYLPLRGQGSQMTSLGTFYTLDRASAIERKAWQYRNNFVGARIEIRDRL